MLKIVNKEKYENLKRTNKYLLEKYRANILCIGYEKAIIAIMKKFNIEKIELEDNYLLLNENIIAEHTPYNTTIIKLQKEDD